MTSTSINFIKRYISCYDDWERITYFHKDKKKKNIHSKTFLSAKLQNLNKNEGYVKHYVLPFFLIASILIALATMIIFVLVSMSIMITIILIAFVLTKCKQIIQSKFKIRGNWTTITDF
eukprot:Pgem_evm1s8429